MRVILEHIRGILQSIAIGAVVFWQAIPHLTQLLVILMAVDLLLGLIIAVRDRQLSAQVAYRGVTKKVTSLLLVGVGGVLNIYIGNAIGVNLMNAATAYYIVPELLSIGRNAAILDVPIFTGFKVVLQYFERQIDTKGGTYVEGKVDVDDGDFVGRNKS